MEKHNDIEDEIEALINKYNKQARLPAFLSRMLAACSAIAIMCEKEKGLGVDFINKYVSRGIMNSECLIKTHEINKEEKP